MPLTAHKDAAPLDNAGNEVEERWEWFKTDFLVFAALVKVFSPSTGVKAVFMSC